MKTSLKTTSRHAAFHSSIAACIMAAAAVTTASAQNNTKTGTGAGSKITSGKHNTANGFRALNKNKTGNFNTGIGSNALAATTGSSNTALGYQALFKNKVGAFNVALGDGALLNNRTGSANIGIGEDGGFNITGSNNICIGHKGFAGQNGVIRIGSNGVHTATFIAGVITGNGSGLTGLTAANLNGNIPGSQLDPASVTATQLASASVTTTALAPAAVTSTELAGNLTLSGTTTGTFSGNGAGLTSLNATNISSGTISDSRLSSNIPLKNGVNIFTNANNNTLRISGAGSAGGAPDLERHVALIRGTQAANNCLLALQSGDADPSGFDNFITFFNAAGGTMGAIDAVNSTTVAYKTTGADFAEILPLSDSAQSQVPAEIVPVHSGEIGNWAKADHFMVISDQAGFVGNDPGREVEAKGRHHRIAFLGQVPVKVHGTVNAGDYIIASDRNDGTGVAKPAGEVGVSQMNRVVGRAWEGSSEEGLKTVNTAVGLDQTSLVVPTLKRLERENQELRERLEKLEQRLAEPVRPFNNVLNR